MRHESCRERSKFERGKLRFYVYVFVWKTSRSQRKPEQFSTFRLIVAHAAFLPFVSSVFFFPLGFTSNHSAAASGVTLSR